uniref:Uncharacterized protein n=1 Tax=Oryza glumipatula TaxID=40148 RepID=A0A0D9YII7_9ORYZ
MGRRPRACPDLGGDNLDLEGRGSEERREGGQVGNDESSQNPIPFQPSSPRRRAAPSSPAAGEGAADEAGWSRSRGLHSIVSQSLPERAPRSRSRRCGGPALAMVGGNI